MKSLVVDDKGDARYLLRVLLEGQGHVVEEATNGEEALSKLRADGFDLVISDVLMPVLDGFQLCREVRQDEKLKSVAFVFYTGTYTKDVDADMARRLGADDFIIKPTDPEALCARIESVMAGARTPSQLTRSSKAVDERDVLKLYSERLVEKLEERTAELDAELAERRKAEEAVRASEQRFRELFDHMSSCVAVYEPRADGTDFVFVDFNIAAERAEGMQREDVIGKSVQEVFPGIGEFGLLDVFRRVWKTGVPTHHPITEYRDERIHGWRENYVYRLPSGEVVAIYDDVTARKQAEETIRWLSSLPDENPNPVMRIGKSGKLLYVNRAGEGLALSWACPIGAMVPSPYREAVDRVVKGVSETREVELDDRVLLLMLAPVAGEDYVNVYSADITELKRAEEALLKREEEYRLLVESASEAIFIAQDGIIRFSNSATMELLGRSADDVGSRPFVEFVHPDDRGLVAERHKRRLAGEDVEVGYEFRFMTADGDVRWGRLNATRVEWQGRPATLNLVSDVSDRRRIEENLRTSEAQLSNALGMAHAGHWEYDVATDTFTFNDYFYRIFRTTAEEVGGYTMGSAEYARRFCHPEDRHMVREETQAAIVSDDPYYGRELVHRILYADGDVGYVAVRFFIVKDSQGRTVKTYGVNQDITERLEAERRIQTALEGTIQAVAQTIETRDPYTAGHQKGVTKLAVAIAQKMQLPEEQVRGIRVAATLHDIGKISVPAEILSKPGRLSEQEFRIIQEHPKIAYEILKGIVFPWPVADIILQHHERLDGSGYPQGLSSDDDILLEARILAVADVVEAMSTHRPYRPALGVEAALDEIRTKRGTQFDSDVVSTCVALFMEDAFALEV